MQEHQLKAHQDLDRITVCIRERTAIVEMTNSEAVDNKLRKPVCDLVCNVNRVTLAASDVNTVTLAASDVNTVTLAASDMTTQWYLLQVMTTQWHLLQVMTTE
ncbi:hypothetical protein EB796_001058 [Bugula neritina]|uniref:Uncharacterized protein n=1 Tax=Bugula neritina TaxID=10212 RepID=A0A7J7KRC3_BUGNE|nr:hypothetical protein EB796_001058 [Bugula neritina]